MLVAVVMPVGSAVEMHFTVATASVAEADSMVVADSTVEAGADFTVEADPTVVAGIANPRQKLRVGRQPRAAGRFLFYPRDRRLYRFPRFLLEWRVAEPLR